MLNNLFGSEKRNVTNEKKIWILQTLIKENSMANQPTARAKFGITSIILNLWTYHLSSVAVLSNLQAFLYFPPEGTYYNLPCIIIYYSILSSVGAWWNTYNSTRSIILNPRQGQQHIYFSIHPIFQQNAHNRPIKA